MIQIVIDAFAVFLLLKAITGKEVHFGTAILVGLCGIGSGGGFAGGH